jgi:acyl-ACP--UDP-N-acetylglucosamine O-acyltransferase
MNKISSKADVSPNAKIGDNVVIYPFAYIEADVEIGDGCVIYPFVSIMNGSRIGKHNRIHQNTVIGAVPQDFEYRGEDTKVEIGDNNVIRENVVINRGTHPEGGTKIGEDNRIMEGVHISHDAQIGNDCIIGYGSKIGGCCDIHNHVLFLSAVIANPYTRVGSGAMVASGTQFNKDVPPYIVCTGSPATYGGVNAMVLSSHGIDEKIQRHITNAYRLIFHGQTSIFDAIIQVEQQVPDSHEIRNILRFMKSTKIGIISKV